MTLKIIEPAIYELLKSLAAGKVYHQRAKQNEKDFIVFQSVDSERWRSINNPSGIAQEYIQVDCYNKESFAAKRTAAQVEDILDGFRGDVAWGTDSPQEFVKIAGISRQNGIDLIDQTEEPLLFRSSATYLVTYHQ